MLRMCSAVVLCVLAVGCAEPTLVQAMKARDIREENTLKIVLRGSEADFGSTIWVECVYPSIIPEIWDSIHASRPYGVWFASGNRRLEFYTDMDGQTPALTLLVNESGAAHILEGAGAYPPRYRCPGLHELLMKLLKEEYDQQHEGE